MKTIIVLLSLMFAFCSCAKDVSETPEIQVKQDRELAEMKPKKPVKIDLKRKENGAYTWEISGDDVEKIVEADRKLRKSLQTNGTKEERR